MYVMSWDALSRSSLRILLLTSSILSISAASFSKALRVASEFAALETLSTMEDTICTVPLAVLVERAFMRCSCFAVMSHSFCTCSCQSEKTSLVFRL
jgi:hypothetical protein